MKLITFVEFGTEGKSIKRRWRLQLLVWCLWELGTATRRKPTDEIFVGEMSLKHWVNDLDNKVVEIVDANLLRRDVEHFAAKGRICAVYFKFGYGVQKRTELPEEMINLKEVASRLVKVRVKFLAHNGTAEGGQMSIYFHFFLISMHIAFVGDGSSNLIATQN